jgi:hypothetical protein
VAVELRNGARRPVLGELGQLAFQVDLHGFQSGSDPDFLIGLCPRF